LGSNTLRYQVNGTNGLFKKKRWPKRRRGKGHLTSEEDGKPTFKGRMMADPLIIGSVVFLG
jgi:hypothetical protein